MTRADLEKKNKIQLWIMLCESNYITSGNCSYYLAKDYTKKDMIDILIKEVEK